MLTLYTMQGFALGVVMCVSLVLNSMGVKMEAQALFSFALYPFSFKILWAPIVDSISFGKFGLRKAWIVFAQTTVALLFFATSFCFETLVEVGEVKVIFFIHLVEWRGCDRDGHFLPDRRHDHGARHFGRRLGLLASQPGIRRNDGELATDRAADRHFQLQCLLRVLR